MKREYLGDSYDVVKRLWHDLLIEWAPLYAQWEFIPEEVHDDFTHFTGIPILTGNPQGAFSILNDPDVGIRLPGERSQANGRTHITIESIVEQLEHLDARCVITFDQSDYRNHKPRLSREVQRQKKITHLRALGCDGFYYASQASFLFAARDLRTLRELRRILVVAGIPEKSHDNRAGIA